MSTQQVPAPRGAFSRTKATYLARKPPGVSTNTLDNYYAGAASGPQEKARANMVGRREAAETGRSAALSVRTIGRWLSAQHKVLRHAVKSFECHRKTFRQVIRSKKQLTAGCRH